MGGWESESDESVLAATAEDPVAFATFYRRYERSMLVFFVRRTGDPELAADLTSTTTTSSGSSASPAGTTSPRVCSTVCRPTSATPSARGSSRSARTKR
jgi:hypothetical protein